MYFEISDGDGEEIREKNVPSFIKKCVTLTWRPALASHCVTFIRRTIDVKAETKVRNRHGKKIINHESFHFN